MMITMFLFVHPPITKIITPNIVPIEAINRTYPSILVVSLFASFEIISNGER